MQINEVQSPDIKKAVKIVQQMYQKKNEHIRWETDGIPSIRAMVKQLNDPLLTSFTKDLDYFIHYGSAWVKLNPNDIFSERSETSNANDMIDDPEYFFKKKSKMFKIVKMRPTAYAKHAKHGFNGMGDPDFWPEKNLIEEYALKVLDGSKMPLPYLRYELVKDERRGNYTSFGQEGRHRAAVATMLGASEMPVMIITGLYTPGNKNELLAFNKKIMMDF